MVNQEKYNRWVSVCEAEKASKIEDVIKFVEQMIKDAKTAENLISDVRVDPDKILDYWEWLEGVSDNMVKAVTVMRCVVEEDATLGMLKHISE